MPTFSPTNVLTTHIKMSSNSLGHFHRTPRIPPFSVCLFWRNLVNLGHETNYLILPSRRPVRTSTAVPASGPRTRGIGQELWTPACISPERTPRKPQRIANRDRKRIYPSRHRQYRPGDSPRYRGHVQFLLWRKPQPGRLQGSRLHL